MQASRSRLDRRGIRWLRIRRIGVPSRERPILPRWRSTARQAISQDHAPQPCPTRRKRAHCAHLRESREVLGREVTESPATVLASPMVSTRLLLMHPVSGQIRPGRSSLGSAPDLRSVNFSHLNRRPATYHPHRTDNSGHFLMNQAQLSAHDNCGGLRHEQRERNCMRWTTASASSGHRHARTVPPRELVRVFSL